MGKNTDVFLLEIQGFALCGYFSDLHAAPFDDRVKVLISQIPDEKYKLEEWNSAASYITNTACAFHSVQEAKKRINQNP